MKCMVVMKKCFIFRLFLLLLLISCSSTSEKDPHSEFNKDMLELNLMLDKNILRPTSFIYKEATSDDFRNRASNFFENLKEPYYLVNYIVSFRAEKAFNSFFRFFVNSLFGFLGLFDVAEKMGIQKQITGYKDTLHYMGISAGNYLILPILGSNSTNYVIGEPISWLSDPLSYIIGFPYMIAKSLLDTINTRAQNSQAVDDILNGLMDTYSVTKNLYLQEYGENVNNSATDGFPEMECLDDFDEPKKDTDPIKAVNEYPVL